MATIIVKADPLVSAKTVHETDKEFLVESLVELYPDGFKTETKIYLDSPHEENEIKLNDLEEDLPIGDETIIWVCHFPLLGLLIGGLVTAAVVGGIAYTASESLEFFEDNAEAELNYAIEQAQAAIAAEIPEETDIDGRTAGIGTSSNNALASQNNTIRLGQKIPQIYGGVRSFPDLLGDAYNFFSTDTDSIGDQTLTQVFGVSEGRLFKSPLTSAGSPVTYLPHSPRIGNQPIPFEQIGPDKEYEINLIGPNTNFVFNDYINHTKDNQTREIWPDYLSGDMIRIDQTGNFSIIVNTNASGNGTFRIKAETYLPDGVIGPYGVYLGILNGNFSAGDTFEFYSGANGELNSTFRIDKISMDRWAVGGAEVHFVEFEIKGATGWALNRNTAKLSNNDQYYLYNQTGSLRGNRVRTGDGVPYPPSVAASSEILYALNKRPMDANFSEFSIFNVNFPSGMKLNLGKSNPVTPQDNYLAKFEVRIFRLDEDGSEIGPLGGWVSKDVRIAANFTTVTIRTPMLVPITGFYVGAKIRRIDNEYMKSSPFTDEDEPESPPFINIGLKSRITEAGFLTERLSYNLGDMTGVELIRRSPKGSDKQPTGKFNAKFYRVQDEYFDFDTGQWVAQSPSDPTQYNKVRSWIQTFMWHANKVGRIPIEDIDYETLKLIDNQIKGEIGKQYNQFDFTFSNKNSNLDEELSLICSAYRVIMYKEGSMYKFGRDSGFKPKVGNITSRNVSPENNIKSVSLSLPNPQDGIELEYVDQFTDKNTIIYIPSDRSATRPKRIFLSGIVEYDNAWRRANYEYLKLFSQRVSRSVVVTKEAMLWDLMDRVTVYDHTRLSVVKPLSEDPNFFRQETEVLNIEGYKIFGSEKIIQDGQMAMEVNLDLPDGSGLGVVKNIVIDIDPDDNRNFTISSLNGNLRDTLVAQMRYVGDSDLRQIGERILIYPISIENTQLDKDDYLIISKKPEGEMVRLEMIRYNTNLYAFDSSNPS